VSVGARAAHAVMNSTIRRRSAIGRGRSIPWINVPASERTRPRLRSDRV